MVESLGPHGFNELRECVICSKMLEGHRAGGVHCTAHLGDGEQDVEEGGEGELAVAGAAAALKAGAVVAHIHIGQRLNELHQEGHDGVQPVRAHLLAHERRQRTCCRADPAVQHIRRARQVHLRRDDICCQIKLLTKFWIWQQILV